MSTEIQKRKYVQRIRSTTYDQFWTEMNRLHSNAFYKAVSQMTEAAEIELQPKQRDKLLERFHKIREEWDGMTEIDTCFSELSLTEILIAVEKEMARAAGLHGPRFTSLEQAREAIDEEYREVWEAIEQGDNQHAGVEAVQLIGVIIKLMRDVDKLTTG